MEAADYALSSQVKGRYGAFEKTHAKNLLKTNQKSPLPPPHTVTQEAGAKGPSETGALRTQPSESAWELSFYFSLAIRSVFCTATESFLLLLFFCFNLFFLPHEITYPHALPSARDSTAGHVWLQNESF